MKKKLTLNLEQASINDVELVGGKNASLGEMLQNLTTLGVHIPGGYVITVEAYRDFLRFNDLETEIHKEIAEADIEDLAQLQTVGKRVRKLIRNGQFPA